VVLGRSGSRGRRRGASGARPQPAGAGRARCGRSLNLLLHGPAAACRQRHERGTPSTFRWMSRRQGRGERYSLEMKGRDGSVLQAGRGLGTTWTRRRASAAAGVKMRARVGMCKMARETTVSVGEGGGG
jgi:hypothetical protein